MGSVSIIQASLQSLIIGHTFLILLIPLLVALFYYSTPYSRRQPIFVLNVLSLALALVAGAISDAINITAILSPTHMLSERFYLTLGFLGNFQMMLVDTILLVRLIAVYPLSRIGLVRFVLFMSLPVTLKVARVVNTTLLIYHLNRILNDPNGTQSKNAWQTLPYEKIEWIGQVLDNSYASIAFLWAIRTSRLATTSGGLVSATTSRQSPAAERIRTLFHLALSNFIIPTILSIAQVVILFRIGSADALSVNNIALVNTMVSVIGVVFATLWAGKERRREVKALLDPFPVQHTQRRMPEPPDENLAITDHYQSDNVSFTSDKDALTVNNRDEEFVRVPDVALLPHHTRTISASQNAQLLSVLQV